MFSNFVLGSVLGFMCIIIFNPLYSPCPNHSYFQSRAEEKWLTHNRSSKYGTFCTLLWPDVKACVLWHHTIQLSTPGLVKRPNYDLHCCLDKLSDLCISHCALYFNFFLAIIYFSVLSFASVFFPVDCHFLWYHILLLLKPQPVNLHLTNIFCNQTRTLGTY